MANTNRGAQPGDPLSTRELTILALVAQGRGNREIGENATVRLSENTVKTYLRRVYRKLGARDRAHAVALSMAPHGYQAVLGRLVPKPPPPPRTVTEKLGATAARVS